MDTTTPSNLSISRTLVPDLQRMEIVDKLFGIAFPLRLEPYVFHMAETLAQEYKGGYWEFYTLSNGGFLMLAPNPDKMYHIICPNGFEGDISEYALSVAVMLYSFSHLSFGGDEFAQTCAQHYHWMREYLFELAECPAILQAID